MKDRINKMIIELENACYCITGTQDPRCLNCRIRNLLHEIMETLL